jgi:hypothetical protein
MPDGLNDDPSPSLIDPIDDPVVTSSSTVESFEMQSKRTADALWRLD